MKVKIIEAYKDTELNDTIIVGTELDVSKERGNQLIESGVAIADILEDSNADKVEIKKVSKKDVIQYGKVRLE